MNSSLKTAVRQVLERRRNTLQCLNTELIMLGYRKSKRAPIILVDWSDLYAHLFSDPLPSYDPLKNKCLEFPETVINAAYEVALSVLFGPDTPPVCLLPPHQEEMVHFLHEVTQESNVFLLDEDRYRESLLGRAYTESDGAGALIQEFEQFSRRNRAPGSSRSRDTVSDAQIDEFIRHLKREELDQYLRQAFGDFYLIAKTLSRRVIPRIKRLRQSTRSSPRKLNTLHDLFPGKLSAFRPTNERVEYWFESISRSKSHKLALPRSRDALALAYIERMNVLLGIEGRSLHFMTRDESLLHTIESAPGSYASLDDRLFPADARGAIPTICRPWDYFFEYGLAVSTRTPNNRIDWQRAKTTVRRRLQRVEIHLEWLASERRTPTQIAHNLKEELEYTTKNLEASLSARNPSLDKHELRSSGKDGVSFRVITRLVRDLVCEDRHHPLFDAIAKELNKDLDSVIETLNLVYEQAAPRVGQFNSGGVVRLLQRALKYLGVSYFEGATSKNRPILKDLLVHIVERNDDAALTLPTELRGRIENLPAPRQPGSERTDYELIRCIAMYCCNATKRIHAFVRNAGEPDVQVGSQAWMLWRLINADILILSNNLKGANQYLLTSHKMINWPADKVLYEATFVNCWLRLIIGWLDSGDVAPEELLLANKKSGPVRQAIARLERIASLDQMQAQDNWPPRLMISVANHILYGKSRLQERLLDDAVSLHSAGQLDEKSLEAKARSTSKGLLTPHCGAIVEYLKIALDEVPVGFKHFYLDTLGSYNFTMGWAFRILNRDDWKTHLDHSIEYFRQAKSDSQEVGRFASRAVNIHLDRAKALRDGA